MQPHFRYSVLFLLAVLTVFVGFVFAQPPRSGLQNVVAEVQSHLVEEGIEVEGFEVDGNWDEPDQIALRTFLVVVQQDDGLGWKGQTDGTFDDAFGTFMAYKLSELDESDPSVKRLRRFFQSLDVLADSNLELEPKEIEVEKPVTPTYTVPAPRSYDVVQVPVLSAGDRWKGYLLLWLNGVFWEYGDEGIIWAGETLTEKTDFPFELRLTRVEQAKNWVDPTINEGPILAAALAMIGFYMSPFGVIAIVVSECRKQRDAGKAFRLGFGVETLEGIVSAFGEYHTMGEIDLKALAMMTGIAGVLTGISCAIVSGKGKGALARTAKLEIGGVCLGLVLVFGTFFF